MSGKNTRGWSLDDSLFGSGTWEAERKKKAVADRLAEVHAKRIRELEELLCWIAEDTRGIKSYRGNCDCAQNSLSAKKRKKGVHSCSGHETELTKRLREAGFA